MASTLEGKIREMNREILRLKTAHPVASNMITFFGVFNWAPDWDLATHHYEITYVEGEQPIMTFPGETEGYDVLFGEPVGNKQIMYDMDAAHEEGDTFTLLSTRQILSVRKID